MVSTPDTVKIAGIPVGSSPSALALMTPTLHTRVESVLRDAAQLAGERELRLSSAQVSAFESYEDDSSEVVVTLWLDATDEQAFALWDDLASRLAARDSGTPPLALDLRWDD